MTHTYLVILAQVLTEDGQVGELLGHIGVGGPQQLRKGRKREEDRGRNSSKHGKAIKSMTRIVARILEYTKVY